MEDENDNELVLAPADAFLLALPNEPNLRMAYETYKTSPGTKRLESERTRTIFSEALIDDERLGTLANLSVRALAKLTRRKIAPAVKKSQANLRIYYDTLDVNLPLKDCYFVNDTRFWRRVVLAKTKDPSLHLKKLGDYDWRGNGISLKYVELVEACQAAYWPEKEMTNLALLVTKYVQKMHISRLQSQEESYFTKFMDTEGPLDASSDFSDESSVSSDEKDTCESMEEEEEEAPPPPPPPKKAQRAQEDLQNDTDVTEVEENESECVTDVFLKLLEQEAAQKRELSFLNQQKKRRESRYQRNAIRQQLRDLKLAKNLEHERRIMERTLKIIRPKPQKKGKVSSNTGEIKQVFKMKVEPEPEDNEDKIPDTRNKQLLLRRIKGYDYPHKDCHHINLSFLRYFDRLNSLTIEFLGPKMEFGYHKLHTRFSYDDMKHLAKGIRDLHQLKILRFRNSFMDSIKLIILVKSLRNLENLEVVDFGCDDLDDSCSVALEVLLDRKIMLKSLELEYNRLSHKALDSIGDVLKEHALQNPEGATLEYLGLGHNLLSGTGLQDFIHRIVGTNHVQKLNLNGVGLEGDRMVQILSCLLREHKPLRHLDMAANCLNPIFGKNLICALETNNKLLHFDCRGCGLSEDQEFEADVIMRRNNYLTVNTFVGDTSLTEEVLCSMLDARRHPIVKKIQDEKNRRDECLKNRPPWPPTSESIEDASDEDKLQILESELDIWNRFSVHTIPPIRSTSRLTVLPIPSEIFVYNPNAFTMKEFRKHLQMPGIGNRYYFFQNQKTFYNS